MKRENFCMFGHHESAQATVLYAQDMSSTWEDVNHVKIEFVLEVHPSNGQAFRAKATHHFITFTHYPQVGDVVNVKYHPKNRQAERTVAQARRHALLSAPPGTPAAHSVGGAAMTDPDPDLQPLMNQEEAERRAAQADGQP